MGVCIVRNRVYNSLTLPPDPPIIQRAIYTPEPLYHLYLQSGLPDGKTYYVQAKYDGSIVLKEVERFPEDAEDEVHRKVLKGLGETDS